MNDTHCSLLLVSTGTEAGGNLGLLGGNWLEVGLTLKFMIDV